jgi:GntR family transcriptional repressor for pyruvate dehydrogenase complex
MSDEIVRQIEYKLLINELEPGAILPSEGELMKQFGVSRSTVRESLRMLEASGMIKVRHGQRGGAVVTRVTNDFISDFLFKAFRLGRIPGESIGQFRIVVEPAMAAFLATQGDISPILMAQMENNIRDAQEIRDDKQVTGYRNMDFHVLLALATRNPMFIIMWNTLRSSLALISSTALVPHETQRTTIEYHKRILKAIQDHEPENARLYMHNHLIEVHKVVKDVDFGAYPVNS